MGLVKNIQLSLMNWFLYDNFKVILIHMLVSKIFDTLFNNELILSSGFKPKSLAFVP